MNIFTSPRAFNPRHHRAVFLRRHSLRLGRKLVAVLVLAGGCGVEHCGDAEGGMTPMCKTVAADANTNHETGLRN
jgi:hypothetical protein